MFENAVYIICLLTFTLVMKAMTLCRQVSTLLVYKVISHTSTCMQLDLPTHSNISLLLAECLVNYLRLYKYNSFDLADISNLNV